MVTLCVSLAGPQHLVTDPDTNLGVAAKVFCRDAEHPLTAFAPAVPAAGHTLPPDVCLRLLPSLLPLVSAQMSPSLTT